MNVITQKFVDFIKEEEGLTTVEYAVAGSLVAATLIVAFTNLGTAVKASINTLITALNGTPAP